MGVQFGKTLVGIGVAVALIGVLVMLSAKLPWLRIGRLPGDINIQRNGFSLYVPVTTMLALSLLLSLAMMLIGRFRR